MISIFFVYIYYFQRLVHTLSNPIARYVDGIKHTCVHLSSGINDLRVTKTSVHLSSGINDLRLTKTIDIVFTKFVRIQVETNDINSLSVEKLFRAFSNLTSY